MKILLLSGRKSDRGATDEGQFRECVACGFEDKQSEESDTSGELTTRVNQRKNEDDHTVKQVVFFKSAADEESQH